MTQIKSKQNGQVFTPDYIVNNICDLAGYISGSILKKHVIDNSCGNGAFLKEILNRYIQDFLNHCQDKETLKQEIETYIHGIELDPKLVEECKNELNLIASSHGVFNVNFDVHRGDSLKIKKFNKKMDFVIGNPPYVRVHNFGEKYSLYKQFEFASLGMTDLYLIFYEIGINMLNDDGVLSYITPSSFFYSVAGRKFRDWIFKFKKIESICDLGHFQPFLATTYTTIVTINNKKNDDKFLYYEYDNINFKPLLIGELNYDTCFIKSNLFLGQRTNLAKLNNILNYIPKNNIAIQVKNGFATLADGFFYHDFDFKSNYIIDVVKASTGKWTKCIFPYDEKGELIKRKNIEKDKNLYSYFINNKKVLETKFYRKGDDWYCFGRTQAIKDVYKDKISINSLFRDKEDIKVSLVPKNAGVYSGLYILTDISSLDIKKAVINDEFIDYIKLLRKYKSGGYYTCSSKDIKKYLDFYFHT